MIITPSFGANLNLEAMVGQYVYSSGQSEGPIKPVSNLIGPFDYVPYCYL